MDPWLEEDNVLSSDLVLSPQEIIAEFFERCEQAADNPGAPTEIKEAAVALCRMLEANH